MASPLIGEVVLDKSLLATMEHARKLGSKDFSYSESSKRRDLEHHFTINLEIGIQ